MSAIILKSTEDLGNYTAQTTQPLTIHAEANGVLLGVTSELQEMVVGPGWAGTPSIGGVAGTYVTGQDVGNQASVALWYWADISARANDNLTWSASQDWSLDVGLLYVYAADLQLDGTQTWQTACSTCTNTTLSANIVDPPAGPGNWIHISVHAGQGVIDVIHDLTVVVEELSGDDRRMGYNDSTVSEQGWEMDGFAVWTGAAGAVFYDASSDILVTPDPTTVVLTAPAHTETGAYPDINEYDNQQFLTITVPEPTITLTYPTQLQNVGQNEFVPGRVPLADGFTTPILTEENNIPVWAEAETLLSGVHTEIVMAEDITSPPEPVWTEDGTDYVYEEPT